MLVTRDQELKYLCSISAWLLPSCFVWSLFHSTGFGSWYNEIDGSCKAKDQEEAPYKGSTVERFTFNLSVLTTILFCVITSIPSLWPCRKFHFQFLFLLIPLAIWMFLRCSRKDMSATAYLIAGLFGAFGGALVVILERIFRVVGK